MVAYLFLALAISGDGPFPVGNLPLASLEEIRNMIYQGPVLQPAILLCLRAGGAADLNITSSTPVI